MCGWVLLEVVSSLNKACTVQFESLRLAAAVYFHTVPLHSLFTCDICGVFIHHLEWYTEIMVELSYS